MPRLNLPHSCKGGNCGSCRARLLRGEIHYPNGPPLGLSDAEAADGFVLLCQARARSDLCIETFEMRARPTQSSSSDCRPHRARAAPVARCHGPVPAASGRGRISLPSPASTSTSCCPAAGAAAFPSPRRRMTRGCWSCMCGGSPAANSPRGCSTRTCAARCSPSKGPWDSSPTGRGPAPPMLLIGGGTGLAPLLCILRHVIENGIERDMTLYWGVRSERDLYAPRSARAELERARAAIGFALCAGAVRALARVARSPRLGARGGARGISRISNRYEVYAAGPPAMIAAVRREFGPRGVAARPAVFRFLRLRAGHARAPTDQRRRPNPDPRPMSACSSGAVSPQFAHARRDALARHQPVRAFEFAAQRRRRQRRAARPPIPSWSR